MDGNTLIPQFFNGPIYTRIIISKNSFSFYIISNQKPIKYRADSDIFLKT